MISLKTLFCLFPACLLLGQSQCLAQGHEKARTIMIPKEECNNNGTLNGNTKAMVPGGTKLAVQMDRITDEGTMGGEMSRAFISLSTLNDVVDADGKVLIPARATVDGFVYPGTNFYLYKFSGIKFKNQLGGSSSSSGHMNVVFDKQADVLPIQRGKSIILARSNAIGLFSPIQVHDVFTIQLVSVLNLTEGKLDDE